MFPNSNIPVIGITGPSGVGKSTAARLLAAMGCAVIDGDELAREIRAPGSPVLEQLASRFGEDILENGILNRALLAERAYRNDESRLALNKITHPAITKLAIKQAFELPSTTTAIAIDAAALPESELMQYLDHIIFIEAPEELRLERIMARDGISKEAALHRIVAQRKIQYIPAANLGYTILKSDESEAAWTHALGKILEGILC